MSGGKQIPDEWIEEESELYDFLIPGWPVRRFWLSQDDLQRLTNPRPGQIVPCREAELAEIRRAEADTL